MAALPMGMRFRPTDEEKINFLLCKVAGQPLPCGEIIGTADIYGEKEPWEILGDSDEGELCFFTMLKKMGKRFSRNVGNGGTWSIKGKKAPIYGGKRLRGVLVGYKRCFRYEAAKGDHQNGAWLLKEYTLPDFKVKVKEEYKDYALCVLKRKGSKVTHDVRGLDNYFMSLSLLLGLENHQEESNYYRAPAAACDLRDIAQQFIREEQSTNIPSFHSQHHYGNLFSQPQDAMIMSSYY